VKCSERVYNNFFKLCVEMGVLYSNSFSLIFLYNLTHGFFTSSGLYYYVFCVVFHVVLFLYVMVHYLCYCILSLCYCIRLFYCAVHCYLFFCVLLVIYVYLSVYIVL
jgi:hypothetical protein